MRLYPSALVGLLIPSAWASDGPKAPATTSAPVSITAVQATATTWPSWRGDPAQTGQAPGTLAPKGLAERWTFTAGDAIVGPAVVDDTHVYVGSKDGSLVALRRDTGAKVWSVATEGAVEAPPLVVGDLVVVGSRDGVVRAVSTVDGALRWKVDAEAEITAGAAYVPPRDGHGPSILVGDYRGVVHRLALLDGASIWTYTTGSYIYGTPAIAGDLAVVGGCDGFVHTLKLADGTAASKLPVEAYVGASVAWQGDRAWVGHFGHRVLAFSPTTAEVAWTHFERSFPYLSSPAVKGELVVLGGRDRVLHALDAKTGEPLWWFPARGKVDSSPVIVGGFVVVGSHDGRVYVVDVETGEEVAAFDLGAAVSASPAVASGWVYVGSEDGVFHAFGPAPKATSGKDKDAKRGPRE